MLQTKSITPIQAMCYLAALLLSTVTIGCAERPKEPVIEDRSLSVPSTPVVPVSANVPFTLTVSPDRSTILATGKQDIFLLVNFDVPDKNNPESSRPALSIGMVIDRSGSMSEKNKLTYACAAASQVVDSLTPADNLAIVQYDDETSIVYPSSPVNSKDHIKHLINSLSPGGSTNLCGGMVHGIEQLKNASSKCFMRRVLLLSDGLANAGITNPEQIAALVRNARREGITVSTMGLGIDYDENLLQQIAENGGGNYYYIESPQQMAGIFREELKTLSAAVADNIVLTFSGNDNIKYVNVYGYKASVSGVTAQVPLSSLHSGEKRSLLIKVVVAPTGTTRQTLGTVTVAYTQNGSETAKSTSYPVSVTSTSNIALVEQSKNVQVTAEALLIEADEHHEKLISLYEEGRKDEAKAAIDRMSTAIRTANRSLNNKKLSKKLEALTMESLDMDRADLDENRKKMYLKSNKQRLLYAQKGKRGKYILQSGDTGNDVELLQKKLQEQNLYRGPVDGNYTPELEASVKNYQAKNNLEDDGVAGPSTLRSLNLY